MVSNKINKRQLTFEQKLSILDKIKNGHKRKDLAAEYKCDLCTISRIVKNEEKIRSIHVENKNLQLKRYRAPKYEQLNDAVTL